MLKCWRFSSLLNIKYLKDYFDMTNNYLNLIENNHDSIYEANGNNKPWISYNKEDNNVYYNHSTEYVEIGGY